MDKRLIIAAGLSILVLFAWNAIFPPPPPVDPPAEPQPVVEEVEPRHAERKPAVPPDIGTEAAPAAQAPSVSADRAEEVVFQNDRFEVVFTNRGAAVTSWKLLRQKTEGGDPLELVPHYLDEDPPLPLELDLSDRQLEQTLRAAFWVSERRRDADGTRIEFRWSDGTGIEARKAFVFRDGDNRVGLEAEVRDHGRSLPVALSLGPGFGAQESQSSYYYESWVVRSRGQVRHNQKKKSGGYPSSKAGIEDAPIDWIGLEDQYFAALVLPGREESSFSVEPIELTRVRVAGEEDEPEPKTEVTVSVSVPPSGAQLFVGPKKTELLETLGSGLPDVVWYFDNSLLSWISRHIHAGLLWIYANVVRNYGVAIIIATFLLRLVLFPVNQFAMVNMKKTQMQMQKLQPKLKRIKDKYKAKKDAESRTAMNQEMMDLYKHEGVNPAGGAMGCLPLLAQFPILIGFYGMLTVAVELRGAPFFGWIRDLSRADPLWITPILMGVTMFAQQMMAMTKVKDPVQQQQQRIMMIMPVVFTVICIGLPAGLVLYWFINNLLGMGQQWLVNKQTTKLEARAQAQGASRKRKPVP